MDPFTLPASSELQSRSIQVEMQLYRNFSCAVYKAFDRARGLPVALKFLLFPVHGNTEVAAREIVNQQACRHPNIVELYDYFWYYVNESNWVGVLELEFMTKDLNKDVEHRKEHCFAYTEEELWEFVRVMVDTLAAAQDLNICHRDLKPQNIFLSLKVYKIGDFGSSKQRTVGVEELSTVGTPFYLSPVLRRGMMERKLHVVHNPYKSDVFSLGLTLLHMAMLCPPATVSNLEEACAAWIGGLRYTASFKQMVSWMLLTDEPSRPDFRQMRAYFTGQVATNPQRTECEHVSAQRSQSPCGHLLCSPCMSVRVNAFQNCYSMTCPLCSQQFNWFMEDTSSTVGVSARWKGFCSMCRQEEVYSEEAGLCYHCTSQVLSGRGSVDPSQLMSSLKYR